MELMVVQRKRGRLTYWIPHAHEAKGGCWPRKRGDHCGTAKKSEPPTRHAYMYIYRGGVRARTNVGVLAPPLLLRLFIQMGWPDVLEILQEWGEGGRLRRC